MDCGDETATEVDREVMRILKEAYDEAKRILSENMDALHRISDYLIKKETITGKEFMEILNNVRSLRPGQTEDRSEAEESPEDTEDKAEEKVKKKNFEDITSELHIDTGLHGGDDNKT